jgi:hypothetical protein
VNAFEAESEATATPLTESSVVRAVEKQASCALGEEAVILHLSSGVYYGLNGVGARIWEMIRTPTRVGTILETILREYEVDRETCRRDLLALFGDMLKAGLVEVRDGPAE